MDFTTITAAVSAVLIVAGITSVAGVKILPGVATWGYSKVINWFK